MSKAGKWSVTVRLDGEEAVTLESGHLSGKELGDGEELAIFTAANQLLAFIGWKLPDSNDIQSAALFNRILPLARLAVGMASRHPDDLGVTATVHQVRRLETQYRKAGDGDRADKLANILDWYDAGCEIIKSNGSAYPLEEWE